MNVLLIILRLFYHLQRQINCKQKCMFGVSECYSVKTVVLKETRSKMST